MISASGFLSSDRELGVDDFTEGCSDLEMSSEFEKSGSQSFTAQPKQAVRKVAGGITDFHPPPSARPITQVQGLRYGEGDAPPFWSFLEPSGTSSCSAQSQWTGWLGVRIIMFDNDCKVRQRGVEKTKKGDTVPKVGLEEAPGPRMSPSDARGP
ncbi:hypothetical protein H920_06983 [Fukomys damarensis]|uniref:Uncharacterized protein n=1 Tax=Fukomys damarensis TaxID=885580 RepID=A0A091DKH0_FUKDA|nr:hypothetical protein H920_06983 [Fukomys damarensis]